jgi:hypothetical protein
MPDVVESKKSALLSFGSLVGLHLTVLLFAFGGAIGLGASGTDPATFRFAAAGFDFGCLYGFVIVFWLDARRVAVESTPLASAGLAALCVALVGTFFGSSIWLGMEISERIPAEPQILIMRISSTQFHLSAISPGRAALQNLRYQIAYHTQRLGHGDAAVIFGAVHDLGMVPGYLEIPMETIEFNGDQTDVFVINFSTVPSALVHILLTFKAIQGGIEVEQVTGHYDPHPRREVLTFRDSDLRH